MQDDEMEMIKEPQRKSQESTLFESDDILKVSIQFTFSAHSVHI